MNTNTNRIKQWQEQEALFPIPADRTAASGRSGRCKEAAAPETDCSGQ